MIKILNGVLLIMKNLLNMLKEEEQQSLTRYISVFLILLFVVVTLYLVFSHTAWDNYDTFAFVTVLGGTGTQMTNKFINSKYNTKIGQVGKPIRKNCPEE